MKDEFYSYLGEAYKKGFKDGHELGSEEEFEDTIAEEVVDDSIRKTKQDFIKKTLGIKKLRTYCEASCDCPTCHLLINEEGKTEVEECFYCQKTWKNKGDYKGKQ